MKRTFICYCLLAVCITPAFGEEQAQSMRARLRGLRGHTAPVAQDATAGPAWSTDYSLTPDTGLTSHSAVWDPATNAMIVFGGIDFGAEATDTNAVLLYTPAAASWTTLIANGAISVDTNANCADWSGRTARSSPLICEASTDRHPSNVSRVPDRPSSSQIAAELSTRVASRG